MTAEPSPPGQDGDDLDALLVAALSGSDERRMALIAALYFAQLDADRDADLDRLRREGSPPVRPL